MVSDPQADEDDRVANFFIAASEDDGLLLPIYVPVDLEAARTHPEHLFGCRMIELKPQNQKPLTATEVAAVDRLAATITLLCVRTMLLKEYTSDDVSTEIVCTEAQAEAATRRVHTQCEKLRPKLLGYVSYPRSFVQKNWRGILVGRNICDKRSFL